MTNHTLFVYILFVVVLGLVVSVDGGNWIPERVSSFVPYFLIFSLFQEIPETRDSVVVSY